MSPTRLVQSLGWLAFLGLLLIGGGYASYIANWQHWVLIAATSLFGGLVLLDALLNRSSHHHDHDHHDHDHGTATDQWVQTLVHLLPLFLVITLGITSLGSQTITSFHKPTSYPPRTINAAPIKTPISAPAATSAPAPAAVSSPVATTPSAPADPSPRGPVQPTSSEPVKEPLVNAVPPSTDSSAPVIFVDGPTPADPSSPIPPAVQPAIAAAVPLPLLDLYYPKKHPGVTRVETIGRLMIPSAEEKEKAPPEFDRKDLKLLLYRHVMTCCAADASPVFVVLRGRDTANLKIDDWVTVTGTWIPAPGLGDMAKIDVDALTVIPAPKEPFLQAPKE